MIVTVVYVKNVVETLVTLKHRAGAGITDHLSRIYDYSVIQTDMRCLRTYNTSIMTKQRFLAILH